MVQFPNLRPYDAIIDSTVSSIDDENTHEEEHHNDQIQSPPLASSTFAGAVAKSLRRRSSISRAPYNDVELAVIRQLEAVDKGEANNNSCLEYEKIPIPVEAEDEKDIYNMTSTNADCTEDDSNIDPFSPGYVGISASYFSVGLMIGGSLSLLYPVLIVKGGATNSLMAASQAVIMVFWSYKIFFGFLSDCFPIFGYKRKPYMIIGWLLCMFVLLALAREGNNVNPRDLVIMLSLANLGYVWADTSADGFMVMIAHREPIEERGKTQTFCYSMMKLGQIVVNVVLLLGMSGPGMNCPGYERDIEVTCSTDDEVLKRVDLSLLENNTQDWCHEMCPKATLSWDLPIPTFALSICFIIATSIPLYLCLKEDRVEAKPRGEFLYQFWNQIQRRAAWQIILYGVTSHITFGVHNAAKPGANYVWLGLSTFQQQLMLISEKVAFFVCLNLVRKYALNMSWKKMILLGTCLVMAFNSLYYLIVFDIWRNSWFYMFTDVSTSFMYTLNSFVSMACMVEVAEPGYEAITYSLITTAGNVVYPLSTVISYQLLAFFPSLNDQDSIATDTPEVRKEFAALQSLVILLNLTSLLTLPLLPRQKKETRELVARGEKSPAWGKFVIVSVLIFLCYSTSVTFITVRYHDSYGCLKILGGGGCTKQESSIPALCLVSFILAYCYGTNFYLSYWPILSGKKKFSWDVFAG